mgnify:CR=1 FL=1
MSDLEYIKNLEKNIELMQKMIDGRDSEIEFLKGNKTLSRKLVEKMERKSDTLMSFDLKEKYVFKFSLDQNDIQDVFSYHDEAAAQQILDEMIIEATRKTLAEGFERNKNAK